MSTFFQILSYRRYTDNSPLTSFIFTSKRQALEFLLERLKEEQGVLFTTPIIREQKHITDYIITLKFPPESYFDEEEYLIQELVVYPFKNI